ncbi:MAG TPA: hypothetical protein VET65_14810, partial [Candidatus Limnocylindrales bacterium]|nr:hypothetical protein [Candidatus Limnocylindrales bacterium]
MRSTMPSTRQARAGSAAANAADNGANGVTGGTGAESLPIEAILDVLRDVRKGNYGARIPVQGNAPARKLIGELNLLIQMTQRSHEDLARSADDASRVARVLEAVAAGDLSQTMSLEGEERPQQEPFRRTARTVNSLVRQLRTFASEVTRVAREVG